MNVKYPVYDSTLAPSMGVMFESLDTWVPVYHLHFVGDCKIVDPISTCPTTRQVWCSIPSSSAVAPKADVKPVDATEEDDE